MDTLLRLLPPIRRTRGPRLYTADGRRFLDLWLDDGREMLGASGRPIRTYAANALDKGLTRPYPGLYEHRLEKALLANWPAFKAVRFYLNEERALAAAANLAGNSGSRLYTLRPFAPIPQGCTLALVRLPCPQPLAPACLLGLDQSWFKSETGDLVPDILHYSAARAMDSLAKVLREGSYGEELWKRFDRRMEPFFRRTGPYLLPKTLPEAYAGFFAAALEGGALLSPNYEAPSMVPPEFDDGELKKLATALQTYIQR